jgi:hypothetical protein
MPYNSTKWRREAIEESIQRRVKAGNSYYASSIIVHSDRLMRILPKVLLDIVIDYSGTGSPQEIVDIVPLMIPGKKYNIMYFSNDRLSLFNYIEKFYPKKGAIRAGEREGNPNTQIFQTTPGNYPWVPTGDLTVHTSYYGEGKLRGVMGMELHMSIR